jgi:hypothetical protein
MTYTIRAKYVLHRLCGATLLSCYSRNPEEIIVFDFLNLLQGVIKVVCSNFVESSNEVTGEDLSSTSSMVFLQKFFKIFELRSL